MKRNRSGGKCASAFGLGLIVAMICPADWLVAILALILIVTGVLCLH